VVAAFADVDAGGEAIPRALETFARLARVDLCSVGLFSRDGAHLETQHTWPLLENVPPPAMPVAEFAWTDRQIRALQPVHVPRTADLPPEAVGERAASAAVGVRSMLLIPLVQRGQAIGYLSCGTIHAERTFGDDEIAIARSVADLLAGALVRARTERDWARLFDCFRGIGADTSENLARLTVFAKDVVGATFARYVRRDDKGEGSALCDEILRGPTDRLVTQHDLSAFAADPEILAHGIGSFVGRVIVVEGARVGALCLGFVRAFTPTSEQVRLLEAVADALAVEEVRAAAQRALQHTLAELEAVLESTAEGVLVADRTGVPLRQNRRFLEIWGVPPEILGDLEAMGRHRLSQLKDPFAYLTRIADLYDDATSTDDSTLEMLDGRTLERTSVPFLVDGQHRGRVWTVRDVTATVRREEELRHALALLEATFEATADGLLVADRRGQVLRENRRLQEMWRTDSAPGDDPQELARRRLSLVEEPFAFVQQLVELYADESSEVFGTVRFRDGRVFERYSLPLKVAGESIGRVMSYRDVTERVRRDEALGQTMALLEATFEATADGVLAVDLEGRPLRFNRHLLELWRVPEGVDPTDIHALRAAARTVPDPKPLVAEWERLCADPDTRESSTVHLSDGGVLERHSVPLWVGGRHAGRVFTYREVTERVRAEFTRSLLATAVDQAGEAVVVTARDGTIEYVNPAFERMSLHKAEDVRGKSPRILKSDRHEPDTYAEMWRTILGGDVWSGRLVNRRADGTSFEVDEVIAPVRAADGTITHFVALLHDVTREHQLEEEVRQAQKMEAVGRLAGGIAHDFNNLLTAVIGYAELIASALLRGERVNEEIDEILRAAKRAASLTQQLLAFSRRQVLKPRVLDLNDVVTGLARMLRRLIPENVSIHAALDPTVKPIKADPGQMEQVMLNLAINARDAMSGTGQLTLATEAVTLQRTTLVGHDGVPPGEYVRLSVRDTGHGMDAATLAHVFEPFFTTKGVGKGTGLGLATVYGIVRQSGGAIQVRSTVGQGTTVEMLFPTCAPATEGVGARPSPVPVSQPARTLLLVEDEKSVRAVVSKVLRASGYRVLEASDGFEALSIVSQHLSTLDALITDVVMPRMSGPELVARVCAERPSLPVLFMSGHVDAAVSGHELPTGAAFLPKPFEPDTLRRAVHNLLSPRVDTPRPHRDA
ncbi:MAG: PAS domain S-box protein, partial [Myxococcales bacterium]|nr:PAS domain S-box protein [Myxococcales bacterium]